MGRLNVNAGGRTLDPRRRRTNYAWAVAELQRRVNARVGGQHADRQNFTLNQLEEAHTSLPELVASFEEELRDASS